MTCTFVSNSRIFTQHSTSYGKHTAYVTALKTINCMKKKTKKDKWPIQLTHSLVSEGEMRGAVRDQLSAETHRLVAIPCHMSKPDDG